MVTTVEKKEKEVNVSPAQQANATFGNVVEKISNPKRTSVSSVTCGNLQIRFEIVEWLKDKDDPTKGYDDPIPNFFATADGYKNSKGYRAEIPLDGDPEVLAQVHSVFKNVEKFVRDTAVDISKPDYYVNDIEKAYEKLGTRK